MNRELYRQFFIAEDRHWWFAARRQIIGKVLDSYFTPPVNSRVLEVGCGTGGNLAMLSRYGDIYAMEMDAEARDLAGSRDIGDIRAGHLPDRVPFDGGFDLVCALDVIEHIDDDLAALQALYAQLRPGGALLVTVPAYRFLWSAHDDANQHKRRYTRPQLLQQVRAAGFAPVYASYFNTFMFPLILAVRVLHNLLHRPPGSDIEMPSTGVNRLLQTIFGFERCLMPGLSLPFGVSVLVIARR